MLNLLIATLILIMPGRTMTEPLLIDDFSDGDGLSALGTRWNFFTDGVMGGVSTGKSQILRHEGSQALVMNGTVSLENNGGFIQVALPLSQNGSFNAENYSGIRIRVKGNGEKYYLHLKTGDTRLPWMHYSAEFDTSDSWQTIDIPFSRFSPRNLSGELDTSSLRRLAVVAAKEAMQAEIYVSRIEFY
jgi:hypothetical protein